MLKSDAYIDKLREIGIDGFISKNVPFAKLHDALLSIIQKMHRVI
jgi:DNA-binding NarL/FixJ family response regulator